MYKKLSDNELVRKYKDADTKAFDELYRRYHRLVFYICRSQLKNKQDAEDMTQEVFAKTAFKIFQYNETHSFKSWLRAITRNTCIDFFRKSQRIIFSDCRLDNITSRQQNPSKKAEDKDMLDALAKYISQMDQRSKDIVCDRVSYQMSFDDIARANSISARHARRICKKTLDKIKDKFDNEQPVRKRY
jgi:RNA polymerase sigma factor (sigma-70 family)